MDDFSIESLYEMGLGFKAVNNSSKVSIEDWDGDRDALAYEMASAESMLDTMDVFSRMTALNSVQQIKCAYRISANYGNCNRGIESYCRNVIQSAEDDNAKAGNDTSEDAGENKDAAKDEKTSEKNEEKKTSFFKKVFGALAIFFRKIWQFICSIPARIKAFIQHIKRHGLKGAGTAASAAGNAKMAAMENKYQAKKNQLGDTLEAAIKEINEIIKTLDSEVKVFCNRLNKASKTEGIKEDAAKILKIMSNMAKEAFTIIQRVFTAVEYGARALAKDNEEMKEFVIKLAEPKVKPLLEPLKKFSAEVKECLKESDKFEINSNLVEGINNIVEHYGEKFIDSIKNFTSVTFDYCKPYLKNNNIDGYVKQVTDGFNASKDFIAKYTHQSKMMLIDIKLYESIVTKILNAVNKIYTDKSFRNAITSAIVGATSYINFEELGKTMGNEKPDSNNDETSNVA